MNNNFHSVSYDEAIKSLNSSQEGLSEQEAEERLVKYGLNKLKPKEVISPIRLFIDQFKGYLVYSLFGAAILSLFIHEYIDGIAILVILLLNGILGFVQEYKAEKAIESLKNLETPHAKVTRSGQDIRIAAAELVPGDIIILNEGDKIPADARLIEAFNLQVEEAILTGESQPVTKLIEALESEIALPDRKNLLFSGTIITRGRAKAIVYATGMNSEIGKIATMVTEGEDTETPLQQTLEKLGKLLGTICVVVALPGLIWGIANGREIIEMVMIAISLAVSAIPEGLPIVVTIALAMGTRRMVKRGVLIRKLPAVEALGSTDIICSDKTGTITLNKMSVTEFYTEDQGSISVKNEGMSATFLKSDKEITKEKLLGSNTVKMLINATTLCNDSDINFGDPTEQALLVLGEQLGLSTEEIDKGNKRIDEVPFDSANKYMITLNELDGKKIVFIKGAPETVLAMCMDPTSSKAKELLKINENLSAKALRVLAVASKEVSNNSDFKKLSGYKFLGLVGMIDPPRAEVKEAIVTCERAGIRVIMITGDHPMTAGAVAKEIGLKVEEVVTGLMLDKMSESELQKLVETQNVFARVSPAHKLAILRALQHNSHTVAMTGDGVNDAPALKEANIGIAVGSGSDLAKEVSDMILLDDNFATIAKAVNEGRGIFFNIKKFVKFLISANFDEIMVILTSIIFHIPLPLLPIQLLWLNLASDSLPALALSADKYDDDLMEKKPHNPSKEIFHGVAGFSVVAGFLAYVASMGIFCYMYFFQDSSLELAQTMTFTTTVFFEMMIVFACRTEKSIFNGMFSNKLLLFAVGVGIFMQFFAVYTTIGNTILKTVPLSLEQLALTFAFASIGVVVIEILRRTKLNFFDK